MTAICALLHTKKVFLKKVKVIHLYSTLFRLCLIKSALHAPCNFPAQAPSTVLFLCEEEPPHPISTLRCIKAMRLPLGAVNLFGMHIIPPLTISAGTHFTYPQGDGGLSQEWVLNPGPLTGRSTVLPTELYWPMYVIFLTLP